MKIGVGQGGVAKERIAEVLVGEVPARQVGPFQSDALQVPHLVAGGTVKLLGGETRILEIPPATVAFARLALVRGACLKVRVAEVRTLKIGVGQGGVDKIRVAEVLVGEVPARQIVAFHSDALQVPRLVAGGTVKLLGSEIRKREIRPRDRRVCKIALVRMVERRCALLRFALLRFEP